MSWCTYENIVERCGIAKDYLSDAMNVLDYKTKEDSLRYKRYT